MQIMDPRTRDATGAAWLTVDLAAVVANWRLLAACVTPARCGAVVKADAYGLGAGRVVRALLAAGCREFFVALVDEGVRLIADLGTEWPANARLHVMHGPLPGEERECLASGLVPVLNSVDQVERWQALARDRGHALPAALQGDTGMARLGLAPADAAMLAEQPWRLEGIAPTLVMSHLASAEEPDNPLNQLQLRRFQALQLLFPRTLGCLANSSGIFLGADFHFDLARPGAALYGIAPTVGKRNPMRAVVRVQAQLIQWREIDAGDAVGYNHTWRAQRISRIATVSVGYADGYLRSAGNRSHLRLDGTLLPVIGRVSMDTVTVDATEVPIERLVPGTAVDVIDDVHDINALAAHAGTNAYEILTSLGARYRRRYLDP